MSNLDVTMSSQDKYEGKIYVEGLSEKNAIEVSDVIQKFVKSYSNKAESKSDQQWLKEELSLELPEKSDKEVSAIANEILNTVNEYDANLSDINEQCAKGISKDTWLLNKISEASKGISVIEYGNYLNTIDNSITNANAQMLRTVTTNSGEISQCMNLDGFIAEQHAVNTFNMQAELEGSKYIAEVCVPEPGETYGLNSFDTVIKDTNTGKIVHQYQFKFGKDAKATIKMLKDGNYNNQRFVVPADQVEEVRKAFPGKSVEAYMGGTDVVQTKSGTLTKEQVKKLQLDTQEKGVLPRNDWNNFNTKELAINIGKNAGIAGIQAVAITTGFDLISKKIQGEEIDGDATIELALKTGADSGIKAATAGALKVVSEKGIVTIIPPGTPPAVIANIACVGIENAKILAKVASGELPMSKALDLMGRTSTSMVYGLGWGTTGMAIGAAALSWVPIVGPIVGGIVGGTIGYMAGSKFGNAVYSGVKKAGSVVKSVASKTWGGIKSLGRKVASGARSLRRKIFG